MLDLFPCPESLPRLNRPPVYIRVFQQKAEGPGRPAIGTPNHPQVGDILTYFEEGRFTSRRVAKILPTSVETEPLIGSTGNVLRPMAKVKFEDFYAITRRLEDPL